MPLHLIAGPAGGGKSQVIASRLQPGEIVIDFSRLHQALAGTERDAAGLLPERLPDDPLVPITEAVKRFAVREAIRRGIPGYATTASRDAVRALEEMIGSRAEIIDPGDDEVVRRLSSRRGGRLSKRCAEAASKWFGNRVQRGGRSGARDVFGGSLSSSREYWRSSSGRYYPVRSR